MIEKIVRLDELLVKASNAEKLVKEAAQLLLALCSDSKYNAKVAEYLMKFKPKVCLYFSEFAVKTLDHETSIKPLFSAMRSTQAYMKNAKQAGISRGFIIAAVLIKHDSSIARETFMLTIADSQKNGKFSDAVINCFKKYVVEYCESFEAIKALGEKAWDDSAGKKLFVHFISAVNGETIGNDSYKNIREEVPANAALNLAAEIIENLSRASKEAATLTRHLSDTNGTIALLHKDIECKDVRIAELLEDAGAHERALREKDESMAELGERLKNSLQMDAISQNQELIMLKANLQNSLKVEYSDFIALKDEACNSDTYGALIASLARIFRTLRRHGITID